MGKVFTQGLSVATVMQVKAAIDEPWVKQFPMEWWGLMWNTWEIAERETSCSYTDPGLRIRIGPKSI